MTKNKTIYLFLGIVMAFRVSSINYNYPEGKRIRLEGRVLTDPVTYDESRYVKINGLSAYVDLYPEVIYGDIIVIEGMVESGKLKNAEVISIESAKGLYQIRKKIIDNFGRSLPQPHAALVSGIVLGSKANMPSSFWEKLKSTGTAHVVVASGMNVTFVTSFLLNLLVKFVNRRKAIVLALGGAWVYVVLSGFDAPLIRAAIMGSVAFTSQAIGRTSNAFRALFYSGLIMLIFEPKWISDLGFILSFVATLSILIFEPKVSRLLYKIPLIIKNDLSTTIAAQIGVAPILYITFGNFNLLSPLINALVLFTIVPIMIIGAMAAVLGLIIPFVGNTVVLLTLPFTFWFEGIVNIFS